MANRLISLTVNVRDQGEWYQTFQELSELAGNMGTSHNYVSLSSTDMGDEEPEDSDDLFHDDKTLDKVRKVLREYDFDNERITWIISDLQNAGILFRERR